MIDDSENHLYMKRDGSIEGVEIVSHPATLDWSRDYPYGKLLRELRKNNCHVDDGYGLHVHVSRNAFRGVTNSSAAHQMSWLIFLYRNVEALEHLARRSSERWASFRKPRKGELRHKALHVDDSSRYVAVNCNNERTYELRFFASTLVERELRAALEFADASVAYTKRIKTHDILRGNALSWDKFSDWASDHNYPNLTAEMADF
ncbi:MAG: amidoligase family protein [Fluviibacter sp.]